MSKSLKIFSIVFLISFVSGWGLNLFHKNLEGFFYWYEQSQNPEMFLAQIDLTQINRVSIPVIKNLEIEAKSAISVLITSKGNQKILFEKNIDEKRPIASLAKLMTALVAQEIYKNPEQVLKISKEAVNQEEEKGELKVEERLSVLELLHIMLIESSNDAAWAIAEGKMVEEEYFIGLEGFVELMNLKVKHLGLKDTYFSNPTGLDGQENYSTTRDLVKITQYIIKNYPQIFEISKKRSYEVSSPDGSLHHFISENTNELLGEIPEIIGGKTGFTEEAGGCILLILETEGSGYLINIILGTKSPEARFQEMKKLITEQNFYINSY